MRFIKALTILLFALTGGCAANPDDRGSRELARKPIRGGVAEFTVTLYDGEDFEGRVLIGATVDPIVIDGRLYHWVNVELKNFHECGKKDWLTHMVFESLPRPPLPDEIITIRPGYWYGGHVSFALFDEELSHNKPRASRWIWWCSTWTDASPRRCRSTWFERTSRRRPRTEVPHHRSRPPRTRDRISG